MTGDFRVSLLPTAGDAFAQLADSVALEDVAAGRRGAVLVDAGARGIPLVRSTTAYRTPAQPFAAIHARLAHDVRACAGAAAAFDSALVEHYGRAYASMKRHTDQALDLADASEIAVYSCYRDAARPGSRRLVVAPKDGGARFDIPLEHGGVVAFSLATNRRYTHAIALRAGAPDNDWLGVTFRTAKTFLRFVDGRLVFAASGAPLTLAGEAERRALFQLRRRENTETAFAYPEGIAYTVSESDLALPRAAASAASGS